MRLISWLVLVIGAAVGITGVVIIGWKMKKELEN